MISSVRNEMYYQYQNVGSYSTKDASNAFQVNSSTTAEASDKLQLPPPAPASSEELSSAEHMEMMCGSKPIPEFTEASSSAVDEETLSEYDLDGDGVLSAEEYSAMMEEKRSEQIASEGGGTGGILSFDADSDGTISADEYEEMVSEMGIPNALTADEFFAQYDVNEDGEISQDEMPAPGTIGSPEEGTLGSPPSIAVTDEETLSEYDLDGDGLLSAEEYFAMMEEKRSEQIASEGGGTEGIASFDKDSDGTISVDEYEEMISEMGIPNALTADEFFAQYDVNEDGEISQDEMPAPGAIGTQAEEVTGQYGEEEDETMSAEYQKLIFKALEAYANHYESMFDTMDGTLKKNQA